MRQVVCEKSLFQPQNTVFTQTLTGSTGSVYKFFVFGGDGARYLDPKTSRWISADPAMYQGDYIPGAPINDDVRRKNGNLPGNNPVKYVDPDGRSDEEVGDLKFKPSSDNNGMRDLAFRSLTDGKHGVSKLNSNDIFLGFKTSVTDKQVKNALKKIWALPWTIFGLVVGGAFNAIGSIMGRESCVSIENNAITFTTGLKLKGSITFGNVIIHAGGLVDRYDSNSTLRRYDGKGNINLGRHEEAHTHQYERYGFFTPFLILGSAVFNGGISAWLIGGGFHGFMGRSKYETQADDYSEVF